MRIALPVACFFAGLCGPVAAQAPCTAGTQAELNQCSEQRYQEADAALNQAYKQAQAKLEPSQADKLRAAQRAWLAFRDAECEAQAFPYREGSIRPQIVNDCLATLTTARTGELRRVYLEQARPNGIEAQALIGTWYALEGNRRLEVRFGIEQGVHYYYSQLDGVPFEAGQWRLESGQLAISANTGKLLHHYSQVRLEDNLLTLYQADGSVEKYQKATEKQLR